MNRLLSIVEEWSIRAILIFGITLWLTIIIVSTLAYLCNWEAPVPDQIPQVEYTFHGHEITVEELEDNDIIQH